MTLITYLMIALLIVACIPLVNVIATWYYLRSAQGIPAFGLSFSWTRSVVLRHRPCEAIQAEDSLLNEGGRAGFEPNMPKPGRANEPLTTAARMTDLAIGFDGHQYTFAGYRYDRFSDAVDYAELIRSRRAIAGQS